MSARAIKVATAPNGTSDEPFTRLVDARPPAPAPAPAPAVRVIETPPGPDGRPRAPRREVEVAIAGYPGFTAWIWANYPQRFREELLSGDGERVRATLVRLVVEHNGWCDEGGEPYPAADDGAFWDAIPTELASLVARAITEAPATFPNSLNGTGGR